MWKSFKLWKGFIKVACDTGFCESDDVHENSELASDPGVAVCLSNIMVGLDQCSAILLLSIKQMIYLISYFSFSLFNNPIVYSF